MSSNKNKTFFQSMKSNNDEHQVEEDSGEFISLLSSEEEEEMNNEPTPKELPILPIRNTVLYPGVVIPITVGRDRSIHLINDCNRNDKILGVVAQSNPSEENPTIEELYEVGTVAQILKLIKMPDGNVTAIIQGKKRFSVEEYTQEEPYFKARVLPFEEELAPENDHLNALIDAMRDTATQIIKLSPNIPSEASIAIKNIESPTFLVNFIASNMNVDVVEKQELLEMKDIYKKSKVVLEHLTKEQKMLELKNEIQSKVKGDIDKQQKDFFLQQQLRAIQEELGQDSPDKELDTLKEKAKKKKWNKEVANTFEKELQKLSRTNPAAAEYSIAFNYLEFLIELPWNEYTKDKLNLENVHQILDRDHYGLEKVKERILEYLAVLKLKGDMKSPILCLYGPPGVGKTSLGRSVAEAMGRKYNRLSLGGLRDEAEIRGHRKTYIGAMPGRIIQSIKKSKSANPVIVLDELDKVGSDFRGDPASALLEVLDPEQNTSFYDNYLEMEFDLSKVLFIATANNLGDIHPALRDRMEIIDINGYLLEEKLEIAKQHLIPKQRKAHGLKAQQLKVEDKVLEFIIDKYTRESGVRTLDKRMADLCRYKAKSIVAEEKIPASIDESWAEKILGSPKFSGDTYQMDDAPGLVAGLAWTPVGGDVLFTEVILSPGKGKIHLTGKLGDVMKESASIAYSYLKSNFKSLDLNPAAFEKWDIHVHVPEGAVPKEGPSAGITIMTALASAFTQRKVKKNIAMTGELTLRGRVLPVGGVKEKILAAKRFGMTDIILSKYNEKDVKEVSEKYLEGVKFHYVNNAADVLKVALEKAEKGQENFFNQPLELNSNKDK